MRGFLSVATARVGPDANVFGIILNTVQA